MQTSGARRRENANLYHSTVIATREGEAVHPTALPETWIASLRSQ